MSPRTTTTAIAYLSALRLLATTGPMSVADLAKADSRTPSNIRRDTPKLVQSNLIDATGDTLVLTETGHLWVKAQDMAEGLESPASPSATPQRWPAAAIRPNPLNRKVTMEGIPALADAIIAAGDLLQPLLLTPPDANGVRTLLAGERRWTAVQYLIRDDAEYLATTGHRDPRLPAALEDGLPFIEREADETEAMVITLLENSNRLDLTPWQDAQQLLKIAEATGWSGAELARRVGRTGSERDIQDKLKIARNATPEAIADYEANGSWDRLRDSVRKAGGPDNINLSLFLVEAALRSDEETGIWDGTLDLDSGLHWPEPWLKWFDYDRDTGHLSLTRAAIQWLAQEGLGEDDSEVLHRHRRACGLTNRPALRPFVTACLNWTPDQVADAEPVTQTAEASEAEPSLPLPEAEAVSTEATPPSEAPASTASLAWRELLHKLSQRPMGLAGTVEVGAFWSYEDAIALQTDRLVDFTPMPGASPKASLTQRGLYWAKPLIATGLGDHGPDYVSQWLTPLQPSAQPAPPAQAEPDQIDLEDDFAAAVDADNGQGSAGRMLDRLGRDDVLIAIIDNDGHPGTRSNVDLAFNCTLDEAMAVANSLLSTIARHAAEGKDTCPDCAGIHQAEISRP